MPILLASAISMLLLGIPFWFILARVGLDPRYSLLTAVPGFGWLLVLGLLAFADWPIDAPPRDMADGPRESA